MAMVNNEVTQEIVHSLAMTMHSFGVRSRKCSPSSFAAMTKINIISEFGLDNNSITLENEIRHEID